jgi:hypothetical protein
MELATGRSRDSTTPSNDNGTARCESEDPGGPAPGRGFRGSTHWSRFFPIGLGMMALAPGAAAWPEASPLIYGLATTAALWFWAYAKKAMFAHDPPADDGRPA